MQPQHFSGSIPLFRVAGIDVRLHWSWFIMAAIQVGPSMMGRAPESPWTYSNPLWYGLQYLGLLASVLAHEFGHALACLSVGGTAKDIVLWPLGGVAFVSPPATPGAVLWTIAAGPLVNLVLMLPLGLLSRLMSPE